jgi:hypothetical protein
MRYRIITSCYRRIERKGVTWQKPRIWKNRGSRGEEVKGNCPLSLTEEDAACILIKCNETRNWMKCYEENSLLGCGAM